MVHILRMAEELKINRDQRPRQGGGGGDGERAGWQWRWGKARKRRREEGGGGRGDHTRRGRGGVRAWAPEWGEGGREGSWREDVSYCTDMTFSFEMVTQAGHLAEVISGSLCP